MARTVKQRPVVNDRFTGFGMIEPGSGAGTQRDYASELWSDIKGHLGFQHTPDVEASFKRRGKAAFQKGKGY